MVKKKSAELKNLFVGVIDSEGGESALQAFTLSPCGSNYSKTQEDEWGQ